MYVVDFTIVLQMREILVSIHALSFSTGLVYMYLCMYIVDFTTVFEIREIFVSTRDLSFSTGLAASTTNTT